MDIFEDPVVATEKQDPGEIYGKDLTAKNHISCWPRFLLNGVCQDFFQDCFLGPLLLCQTTLGHTL